MSLGGKNSDYELKINTIRYFYFYSPKNEFTGYLRIQIWLEIRSSSMIDSSKNVIILQL